MLGLGDRDIAKGLFRMFSPCQHITSSLPLPPLKPLFWGTLEAHPGV